MKKATSSIWFPFPEAVPETEGFYLLTVERSFCGEFIAPDRELRIGYWACNQFFAKLLDEERITAWAFSPSLYIKEQTNERD